MGDQANEQRYDWLRSQQRFHARKTGKWHKSQARWYRRAIRTIPCIFWIIVGRVLRRHQAAIAKNITTNNPLFSRLRGAA
jgi:hypothetical protein